MSGWPSACRDCCPPGPPSHSQDLLIQLERPSVLPLRLQHGHYRYVFAMSSNEENQDLRGNAAPQFTYTNLPQGITSQFRLDLARRCSHRPQLTFRWALAESLVATPRPSWRTLDYDIVIQYLYMVLLPLPPAQARLLLRAPPPHEVPRSRGAHCVRMRRLRCCTSQYKHQPPRCVLGGGISRRFGGKRPVEGLVSWLQALSTRPRMYKRAQRALSRRDV
jgi:hypothetical protein